MATFEEMNQKGKVSVSELITAQGRVYKFEYTKYDADTGDPLPETAVDDVNEQQLIRSRAILVGRRDEYVAKQNAEIAEIDAKLAAIAAVKT